MITYRTFGKGKVLLLIHGFGIGFDIWKKILNLLKPNFRVVVIELPGIGKSKLYLKDTNYFTHSANQIEVLRKKLKVKKWTLISYSIGGRVAEVYTNQYSKFVRSAIFIFPLILSKHKIHWFKSLISIDEKLPFLGNWFLTGLRLKLLIILLGFNGRPNKEVLNWYGWIGSQSLYTLKTTLRDVPNGGQSVFDISKVPTLFIWGKSDVVSAIPSGFLFSGVVLESEHGGIVSKAREISEVIHFYLNHRIVSPSKKRRQHTYSTSVKL